MTKQRKRQLELVRLASMRRAKEALRVCCKLEQADFLADLAARYPGGKPPCPDGFFYAPYIPLLTTATCPRGKRRMQRKKVRGWRRNALQFNFNGVSFSKGALRYRTPINPNHYVHATIRATPA